jgi:hypothetical protein
MAEQQVTKPILMLLVVGLILIILASQASAVPSFKRQTGQDCIACHTIFPELTPLGRAFKLTGYVLNNTGASHPSLPPISGMIQLSLSRTNNPQPQGSLPADIWSLHSLSSGNDAVGSPQQLSVFYAGQIYGKLGAFIQGTYANDVNKMALDAADIRYANNITLFDKDLIFGVTLNNNPTIEDVWNSTPAFSFPYAASNMAPTPAAATVIDNGLGTQVGGAGLYAYWNNMIYAAVSVYRTSLNGITYPFGAGNHPFSVYVDGAIPYWRVALTHQYNSHSFSIGTYGLSADIFAGDKSSPTDHFSDIALDAQYQYISGKHAFSVQTTWIHEDQNRSGSFAQEAAANQSDSLDTYRINGNYSYRSERGTIGGSVGFFSTTGDIDSLLYASDPVSGSLNGSPNSNGIILELDYVPPWAYLYTKFSLQYVIYNQFNGASSNYDGFGRNASDNNTLYFMIWCAF